MTISTNSNTVVVHGNGLTTSFSYTFPVPLASELLVYFTDSTGAQTLLQPNQYSVTGIGSAVGGSVTYPLVGSPIALGTSLTIQRVVAYQQLTDLVNQSGFYPNVVENALDYLTMQTQQLAQMETLALTVPLSSAQKNLVLPGATARSNQLVGFDNNGNAVTFPITASVGAGNLTIEGPFLNGVNFTAGTSNSVTLSQSYGNKANLGTVVMAGVAQSPDSYSLTGNVLTFNAVIPLGVDKIWCIGGTTLSLGVPPNGTVGDAQLAWGNVLGRVCDSIAALGALNVLTYTRAFVTGYYAAGDGGGGAYYYSASTPQANANGGTIIAAAGGVGCWLLAYTGLLSVKQFGAKGDGATDDTAAMQAAHNTGRLIYYQGANYKFSKLTMSAGGIVGDGEAYTYLTSTDTTAANVIAFSATNLQPGANAPVFEGFTLNGQGLKSTGNGLFITAPSSENQGAQLAKVTIYGFPICLGFGAASYFNVQNCKFINYTQSGISVNNTNNADSGDSVIMGCLFNTSVGVTPAGINYISSGGLKVIGNKFNGGSYGFFIGLNATANTSDLLMLGNSIENQSVAAIQLSRQAGTQTFSNIVITGNQIAICPYGVVSDASGAFSEATITGNAISLSAAGNAGINLAAVTDFNISGNTIKGNGGTPSGISIAASCINGKIGRNTYSGLTATVNNSSTTTYVAGDAQSGTSTVTTSTAYGSLFSGSNAITFPVAYTVVPTVDAFVNSGSGGGISAFATNVTKTGFTLNCVGATNGGSVGCAWNASGII